MNPTPMNPKSRRFSLAAVVLVALLAGCASQASRVQRLPFHVAILPPVTVPEKTVSEPEGSATELALTFDGEAIARKLAAALGPHFCKVTRLRATQDPMQSLQQAQQAGADLILGTQLGYDPRIYTSLNDRFWLNLPLFALGGPFCWFVSDRSYYCNVQLQARLYDVTVASSSQGKTLDDTSLVMPRMANGSTEASLNFLDRADGAGPYLLSLVLPAGLIASESGAVPGELGSVIGDQLCQALVQTLQNRSIEVTGSDLVDFEPHDVRVVAEGTQRHLVGEVVLELGRVDDLGSLRYRFDNGEFVNAKWGTETVEPPSGLRRGRKSYPFRIAVADGKPQFVQLEVQQRDRRASRRTFTYALATEAVR